MGTAIAEALPVVATAATAMATMVVVIEEVGIYVALPVAVVGMVTVAMGTTKGVEVLATAVVVMVAASMASTEAATLEEVDVADEEVGKALACLVGMHHTFWHILWKTLHIGSISACNGKNVDANRRSHWETSKPTHRHTMTR